ncbi:hypothetical protein BB561_000687 [Smittium simulii]|uniref:Uncharacterized protein n=1 Tax=Smittium simulii TaxID=133385 RepID=A0A2T9YY33_9FUNG|nr:hypothetical protein BB561_000687 [Smittium simulii]
MLQADSLLRQNICYKTKHLQSLNKVYELNYIDLFTSIKNNKVETYFSWFSDNRKIKGSIRTTKNNVSNVNVKISNLVPGCNRVISVPANTSSGNNSRAQLPKQKISAFGQSIVRQRQINRHSDTVLCLVNIYEVYKQRIASNTCHTSHTKNGLIKLNRLLRYLKDYTKPLTVDIITRYIHYLSDLIKKQPNIPIPKACVIGAILAESSGGSSDDIVFDAFCFLNFTLCCNTSIKNNSINYVSMVAKKPYTRMDAKKEKMALQQSTSRPKKQHITEIIQSTKRMLAIRTLPIFKKTKTVKPQSVIQKSLIKKTNSNAKSTLPKQKVFCRKNILSNNQKTNSFQGNPTDNDFITKTVAFQIKKASSSDFTSKLLKLSSDEIASKTFYSSDEESYSCVKVPGELVLALRNCYHYPARVIARVDQSIYKLHFYDNQIVALPKEQFYTFYDSGFRSCELDPAIMDYIKEQELQKPQIKDSQTYEAEFSNLKCHIEKYFKIVLDSLWSFSDLKIETMLLQKFGILNLNISELFNTFFFGSTIDRIRKQRTFQFKSITYDEFEFVNMLLRRWYKTPPKMWLCAKNKSLQKNQHQVSSQLLSMGKSAITDQFCSYVLSPSLIDLLESPAFPAYFSNSTDKSVNNNYWINQILAAKTI